MCDPGSKFGWVKIHPAFWTLSHEINFKHACYEWKLQTLISLNYSLIAPLIFFSSTFDLILVTVFLSKYPDLYSNLWNLHRVNS